MDRVWHILRVIPQREAQVADLLPGVEVYSPTYTQKRFNRRFRVVVTNEVPLFPGYVFAVTEHPYFLRPRPNSVILGFLRNGDASYCTVRDEEIFEVQKVAAEMTVLEATRPAPKPAKNRKPTLQLGAVVECHIAGGVVVKAIVDKIQSARHIELETIGTNRGMKIIASVSQLRAPVAA